MPSAALYRLHHFAGQQRVVPVQYNHRLELCRKELLHCLQCYNMLQWSLGSGSTEKEQHCEVPEARLGSCEFRLPRLGVMPSAGLKTARSLASRLLRSGLGDRTTRWEKWKHLTAPAIPGLAIASEHCLESGGQSNVSPHLEGCSHVAFRDEARVP